MSLPTDSKFNARLAKSPSRKRKPRVGPVVFVLTVIVCVATAIGYRQFRAATDHEPMMALAAALVEGVISGPSANSNDEPIHTLARETLTDVEADLDRLALHAVGGCRAELQLPGGETLKGIIGNVYVRDSSGLYAIEFTGAYTEEGVTITQVWKASRVSGDPRAHARAAVDALLEDEESDADGSRISDPKFFYYDVESFD